MTQSLARVTSWIDPSPGKPAKRSCSGILSRLRPLHAREKSQARFVTFANIGLSCTGELQDRGTAGNLYNMAHKALFSIVCALFLFAGLAAAGAQPVVPPASGAAASSDTGTSSGYTLGSGDKVRVNVFGQADLAGEYVVDGAGFVQLPLIGQTKAAGLTVLEFQKEVTTKFAGGYLINPSVDVEVITYRPFYIIGEVKTPGQYGYINGMSILNAIALAGGYTDRADKSEVYVRRNGASKEIELPADETTKVNPGDILRVSERFF